MKKFDLKNLWINRKKEVKERRLKGKSKIKSKERFKRIGLTTKIALMLLTIILVMTCMNAWIMSSFSKYNNQYNAVLLNIISANHINNDLEKIKKEIKERIIIESRILESSYGESLSNAFKNIEDIKNNTVSNSSSTISNTIERNLKGLSENIEKESKLLDSGQKIEGMEKNRIVKDISASIDSIQYFVKNLILSEVESSDSIRQSISNSFSTNILASSVVFVFIIALIVLFSWRISNNINKAIKEICNKSNLIASGKLNIEEIKINTKDELEDLASAFNHMVLNLKEIVYKLNDASKKIQSFSNQVAESSEQNSKAGEEIAGSVQEMYASLEVERNEVEKTVEISNNLHEVSKEIEKYSDQILNNANKSVELSLEGNENINEYMNQIRIINTSISDTATVISDLNKKSVEMSNILNIISSISSQTNLLSLNAAIEAARVGEAGKGFAVVANEIRELAEESGNSVKEIGSVISSVQEELAKLNRKMQESLIQLEHGNGIAERTKQAFELIENANKDVNGDAYFITQKLDFLSDKIEGTNKSIHEIQKTINGNAEVSESISAAIQQQTANLEEVTSAIFSLSQLAEELDIMMNNFVI